MTTPTWLIPALRVALRVAVRLLRRYDAAHPQPAAPDDLVKRIRAEQAALETQPCPACGRPAPTRKLTELDIP